jgi:hypothetical protein
MRAVDQVFERAGATLACTSYQWRCWLNTYHKDSFWTTAFRELLSQHNYISVWKMFICYIFRVSACSPRKRKQIYNLKLWPEEIQMMDYILELLEEVEDIKAEDEDLEEEKEYDEEAEDDYYDDNDDNDEDEEQDEAEKEVEEDTKNEQEEDEEKEREQSGFTLPSGPMLKLSEALFQLSMMFWTHQDLARDMTSSILVHFTAVLGIHRHSLAYRSAYNSTSGFAYLMWIGRLLFLEYALPLYTYTTLPIPWPARNVYPSQRERLEAIRTKYLLRGSQGPFREIIELKAYAKSIVRQEGGPSNLSYVRERRLSMRSY